MSERLHTVDVDHQLFVSGADGRIETLPGLQATTEIKWIRGSWEKETIPSHHYTSAVDTIRESRHDKIESRKVGHNIEITILLLTLQVPM